MCGIVGAISKRDITGTLLEGLKRLEYRGYDSAGIAVINQDERISRLRFQGKVKELETALNETPLTGELGIAHTRWATHGKPSDYNAHPHMSGSEIAIVHNGIIENHEVLRQRLSELGYEFESETDSEIIAHLIHHYMKDGKAFMAAAQAALKDLEGAFALAIIHGKERDRMIVTRLGSPLVIGIGDDEHFVASDQIALLPFAKEFIYLEEGDLAEVRLDGITILDRRGELVERPKHISKLTNEVTEKGEYRHFMLKEIFDQPEAILSTLEGRLSHTKVLEAAFGAEATKIFDKIKHVQIVACGTSYHAGMVARYWFEEVAGIPCQVEIASEFRYRGHVTPEDCLFVTISQSGETADTLAALKEAKRLGYMASLSICNVPESSLVRESDLVLMTRAGIEIGVASTKAFTTQLTALLLLVAVLGRRFRLTEEAEADLVKQLHRLPTVIQEALALDEDIQTLAMQFADKNHTLFLGRGTQYPIALEGALKLKEISYIHAEAYPAGELKHGPLALVDKEMPVVAVAPNDELLEKLKSNLQEVRARGGELIVFADLSAKIKSAPGFQITHMPTASKITAPILYTIPLQLLAYHVAVLKGTDVDQPRNLAKSVTVE